MRWKRTEDSDDSLLNSFVSNSIIRFALRMFVWFYFSSYSFLILYPIVFQCSLDDRWAPRWRRWNETPYYNYLRSFVADESFVIQHSCQNNAAPSMPIGATVNEFWARNVSALGREMSWSPFSESFASIGQDARWRHQNMRLFQGSSLAGTVREVSLQLEPVPISYRCCQSINCDGLQDIY